MRLGVFHFSSSQSLTLYSFHIPSFSAGRDIRWPLSTFQHYSCPGGSLAVPLSCFFSRVKGSRLHTNSSCRCWSMPSAALLWISSTSFPFLGPALHSMWSAVNWNFIQWSCIFCFAVRSFPNHYQYFSFLFWLLLSINLMFSEHYLSLWWKVSPE